MENKKPLKQQFHDPPSPTYKGDANEFEHHPHHRLFHRSVALLFLVLIVVVFVYAAGATMDIKSLNHKKPTPTPNDISNWKTYTNSNLGYSVKYPSNWFIYQDSILSYDPSKITGGEGFNKGQFKFEIAKNVPTSSIHVGNTQIISKNGIKVDGFSADRTISYIYPTNMLPTYINIFIQRIKDNFSISGYYNEAEKDKYIKLFDQMISTFKFTDFSPTPTCKPRPACLDARPACKIPETPDMCPPKPVFCTQEAKQCPDGSYVGRQGPKCEFTPCPIDN